MYWYKVKSALIILFLAINIFLLARIGYVAFSESKHRREELSTIVSVLQGDNVTLSADRIPSDAVSLGSLSAENVLADEKAFTTAILGKGILIANEKEHSYTSGSESLEISDNKFYYHNSAAGTNITPNQENAEQIKLWLSDKGFYMDETAYTLDTTRISYRLVPGGNPFFDAEITVIPGERGVISMTGNWVTPAINSDVTYQPGPVADALIAFYRDPDRPQKCEVASICAGYGVLLGNYTVSYKTAEAVPVWRIKLTDGKCFYYDAR